MPMKTSSFLTGNLLFDGNINIPHNSTIKISIEDVSDKQIVLEKDVEFDSESLSVFRYLPFEIKEFETEAGRSCKIQAHVDIGSTGKVKPGDFITKQSCPVITGFEEINLQLELVC